MGIKHKPELRGGSWNNNDNNCRVANRNNNNPDNRNNNNGLRLANAIDQARTGETNFCREREQIAQFCVRMPMASNDYIEVSRAILSRKPEFHEDIYLDKKVELARNVQGMRCVLDLTGRATGRLGQYLFLRPQDQAGGLCVCFAVAAGTTRLLAAAWLTATTTFRSASNPRVPSLQDSKLTGSWLSAKPNRSNRNMAKMKPGYDIERNVKRRPQLSFSTLPADKERLV